MRESAGEEERRKGKERKGWEERRGGYGRRGTDGEGVRKEEAIGKGRREGALVVGGRDRKQRGEIPQSSTGGKIEEEII